MRNSPARHSATGAILAQRIKHDLADRFSGLPRERPRQMRGFCVADVNLISHDKRCYPDTPNAEDGKLVHMYPNRSVLAMRPAGRHPRRNAQGLVQPNVRGLNCEEMARYSLYDPDSARHKPAMAFAERLGASARSKADSETGGTLTIDLDAVEANWRALAQRIIPAECAAVVKADAYGLGLEAIATKLARAGCRTFFVADLAEARRLRGCARDVTIYVLNGCSVEGAETFVELNARPVINSMAELAEWDAFVAAQSWDGGAALHVDTGMNRLGISLAEAAALAPRVRTDKHGISLLMSHFACAEIADHPLTASQIKLFRDLRRLYGGVPASLANSSGIFLGDIALFDLTRAGAALYGINPTPGRPNPMRSVVELTGRMLQVRDISQGETIGYGATWTAKRTTQVAVVALGYADGLMRAASGSDGAHGGAAIIAGRRCPVVGRISMDLVCIDTTDVQNGAVRRGDLATFIGAELPVDDVAASAGTIGYEILTRLGSRCRLIYRGT